jgi:hypothetical protein
MAYATADIQDILDEEQERDEQASRADIYTPRVVSNSYKIIPPVATDPTTLKAIHRMNSLGSLYYFATVVLGKKKFQTNPDPRKNLHLQMCKVVEKDGLQDVIEIPRDHFKSSVYSECLPIWRSLPFTDTDEHLFRAIGYDDRFILWMRRAHRQDQRWLLVSEVILNAQKLGQKIAGHYESNEIFKHLFPEILPDSSCQWNNDSLTHKRTAAGRIHGEGTYDFIGVGGALQSRHYDGIVQDDLVGRKAFESPSVLEKTIEYHQLLVGVMDADNENGGRENDEVIVGNRWSYNDLNSYIRAHENYFNFTTHSALGGCCSLHPYGTPIFPEAFSVGKLEKYKKRLGNYLFSCQFLNVPINPAETKFKKADLRYFEFVRDSAAEATITDKKRRVKIRHHVHEGDVIEDVYPRNLKRYIIVDPNHAGNEGRCRHAITITGIHEDPRRVYLLDVWAKACPIDEFITQLFILAWTWKVPEIYLETIAAQKYLKYHLDYMIKGSTEGISLGKDFEVPLDFIRGMKILELKTPKTKNAKQMRIDSLSPIFERNEFWMNSHGQNEFMEEFESYPNGALRDVLDTLGYGPQVWEYDVNTDEIEASILERLNRYERNSRSAY